MLVFFSRTFRCGSGDACDFSEPPTDFFTEFFQSFRIRAGRRDLFLWSAIWFAESNQRPSELFSVGALNYTGEIVIVVGESEKDMRKEFDSVMVAATQQNPYAFWYGFSFLTC